MSKGDLIESIKVKVAGVLKKPAVKKHIIPRAKLAGLAVALSVAVFVILNGQYFIKQASYWLRPPQTLQEVNSSRDQSPQPLGTPNTLTIPSLDITAPVIYVTGNTEKDFQTALISGVVHFPGTADAGQAGNDYIFGHSSDFLFSKGHYKTVFALLPRIQLGAIVTLSDSSGKVYTYKVTDKFVVNPDDVSVLKQDYTKHILTIQTSYPVGTALRRYIVVTELQN